MVEIGAFLGFWQMLPSCEEMNLDRQKPNRLDNFDRKPVLARRNRVDTAEIRRDAETAGQDGYLSGFVAAAMLVAYADGNADLAERRRLIAQFRANSSLAGFSVEELAAEVESHVRVFDYDPASARARALGLLRNTDFSARQTLALLSACRDVIAADGLTHPAELGALQLIGEALGVDELPSG